MAIHFDEKNQLFHLQGGQISYVIQIIEGYPVHIYWGNRLKAQAFSSSDLDVWEYSGALQPSQERLGLVQLRERSSFHPNPIPDKKFISLDTLAQEYPQYGSSDMRQPAYQVQLANGSRLSELKYKSHLVLPGKPYLEGLPATYTESDQEAETLVLKMVDETAGLIVHLMYTVFANHNAVARSARFENVSGQIIQLEKAASAALDLADCNYELISLWGAHERERHVQRQLLSHGTIRLESRRGSSSHQMNPFAVLTRPTTTEQQGEAFGISLVYSGNFCIETEVDAFDMTRLTVGINDFEFGWTLKPGENFQTPEAVFVYSNQGIGGMSRTYHNLYRARLCRGPWRDEVRPILINNWEATYFDFDAEKLEAIAHTASDLGIELFVLDDGWFGHRDNDNSSLGDWQVNTRKLPRGLRDLGDRVNEIGMQFGIWVEPEMVSIDSELYREHPDWCLHVPGRRRSQARNQLILDLTRQEVIDFLFEALSRVFLSAPISYVKWDMNRNFSEAGSAELSVGQQKEVAHRYILGLYQLMERLVTRFPHILFESCSGGGGRFDPGMLYYMPQTWTSDNSDAVERLKIQYGTSLVYPLSTMGAHVSAVPNHQVHRMTSLEMRGNVAMSGNFGFELDLTILSDEERETIKQQTTDYKRIRSLVQLGDQYRLLSPFDGNYSAWMIVSKDRREAVVYYFRTLSEPNPALRRLKLAGLDPELNYQINEGQGVYGGDWLMQLGWAVPLLKGDFTSTWFTLHAR
ncbi:MAG: alpha-galactosidase [Eubacteriales bacterium]|nr:alpha-galactosidase [Eubacteriales bacterium]